MRTSNTGPLGLADIFFGPLANLLRRRRAARAPGRRMTFETLESRLLPSADLAPTEPPAPTPLVLELPANEAADSYTLRLDAENGDLEVLDGTEVVLSRSLAATSGVVISGEDGYDDSLTIDFDHGGFFSLADGITFNGGDAGNDTLTVSGGSFASIGHTYTESGPGLSGNLTYDDGTQPALIISYTDLEPLINGGSAANLVFTLSGADDQAVLEDDGIAGNGISRLRSINGTFETTTFTSNTATSLTINLGAGIDSLQVLALPDFTGALTVTSPSGTDSVSFDGATSFSALTIATPSGGGLLSNSANLTVSGAASLSASQINLGTGSGVVSFGTLNFNSGTVQITHAGDVVLSGSSTASGNLTLTSSGTLTDLAGASLTVGQNATFSNLLIHLADATSNSLTVGGRASFTGAGVTIAPQGTVNFGSVSASAAGGSVFIIEDSAMELAGITAENLTLSANGALTDAVGTNLSVSDFADLTANGLISLGDSASDITNFGRLTFRAIAGGVGISEDSNVVLTGNNSAAGGLLLTAGGVGSTISFAATDGGSLTATGTAFITASSVLLGLADNETVNLGALNFNVAGSMVLQEDSATELTSSSTAGSLSLTSAGAITDSTFASVNVSGAASLSGTSITLGEAGGGNAFNTGLLNFNSAGAVDIRQVTTIQLFLPSTADTVTLNSSNSIIKGFSGSITADTATLTAGANIGAAGAGAIDTDVTSLNARSGAISVGGIFINELDTVSADGLAINLINADDGLGNIGITVAGANGDLRDANGEALNLIGGTATLLAGRHIGSFGDAIETTIGALAASSGTVAAAGDIYIEEIDGGGALGLLLINADGGAGAIEIATRDATGDLTDNNGTALNLVGSSVGLKAGRHIGTHPTVIGAAEPLEINAGTITAISGAATNSGNIRLQHQGAGSLGLNTLTADEGTGLIDIQSTASTADLLDANGADVNLMGGAVTLTSGRHIGVIADALDTEITSLTATSGIGADAGDISINELAAGGSLAVNTISADGGNGTVFITTNGATADITDGNGSALNLAGNLILSAGRHIGFDGVTVDALDNDTVAPVGALTASSGTQSDAGDIYLVEAPSGVSLRLNTVIANEGAGSISILANNQNADISDANGAAVNLVGSSVTLHAGRHIGNNGITVDAIETDIGTLTATSGTNLTSGSGEIYLDERESALTVLDLSSTGHVELSAFDEIILAGNIEARRNEVLLAASEVGITGVLNVDIGGVGDVTRYTITGNASLGGTLDADLVNGFLPVAGNRLRFMTFASSDGDFAATDLPENLVIERHDTNLELVFAAATPTISIGDVTLLEGDAGFTFAEFEVTLSTPSTDLVTFNFTTVPGSAAPDDFAVMGPLEFFFLPGETSRLLQVRVNGDRLYEGDETFTVQLSDAVNATIDDGEATGTILNDDPVPTLSIGDASVIEGDDDTTVIFFPISLSNPSSQMISLDFQVTQGTATEGLDYFLTTSQLFISPGSEQSTLAIHILGDLLDEADETFTVTLLNPVNVIIADGQATGTIIDDDVQVSIGDATVLEGDAGLTPAVFEVTLSSASTETVTVEVVVQANTAGLDDFVAPPAPVILTFAPGETVQQFTVPVIGDRVFEPNETFFVAIRRPVNASIDDFAGVGTILNDDPLSALSIGDASVTEGNTGTTIVFFDVTLSNPSAQTITVDYSTSDGTASAGSDYLGVPIGTLTFAPGEILKHVAVTINGDTLDENDETFNVALSSQSNASIADGHAIGTIVDDDLPSVSISDAEVVEGDSGGTIAFITLTLSNPSTVPIAVDYVTVGGTATIFDDFAASNGAWIFNPGETVITRTPLIIGDTIYEADETFFIELLGADFATIADGHGVVTILNDDPPPALTIGDRTIAEGDSGTTVAVFEVSLSNASAFETTVAFATADGTALAGSDYDAATGTLTFAPGETSKQVLVTVKGDVLDEADETFNVTLFNATNASIADAQGLGTILDDDDNANAAPVFDEIGPRTVEEGRELRFIVNATDADDAGNTLTFTAGLLPAGATFNAATREFVWVPVDDASTSVTFTVTDPDGASDVMTVALTATNAAPTVEAGPNLVVGLQDTDDHKHEHKHTHGNGHHEGDGEAEVSIAAVFDDPGLADTHKATIDWGDGTKSKGKVVEPTALTDGTVKGSHVYTEAGVYKVTVTVRDDDGGVRYDTLYITVKKPVEKKNFESRRDEYKLDEDTVLRVDAAHGVLGNDRVPSGATPKARVVEGPEYGKLTFNADGSFVYVPERDFHGKDSFWYEFTDGSNVSHAVQVVLNVKDVKDKPSRPCVDWDDCWRSACASDDFLPFGKRWRC